MKKDEDKWITFEFGQYEEEDCVKIRQILQKTESKATPWTKKSN